MILTKEHLESISNKYAKEHNTFEVMGFEDGLNWMLEFLSKKLVDKELSKSVCWELYKKGLTGGCDFEDVYKKLTK